MYLHNCSSVILRILTALSCISFFCISHSATVFFHAISSIFSIVSKLNNVSFTASSHNITAKCVNHMRLYLLYGILVDFFFKGYSYIIYSSHLLPPVSAFLRIFPQQIFLRFVANFHIPVCFSFVNENSA